MQNTSGSEWKKWDLHLHTPGTTIKSADRFDDNWNGYLKKLASSDVEVFGITDYFSIDGYKNVYSHINNLRKSKLDSDRAVANKLLTKKFFPNIELRLTDQLQDEGENNHINLHILFFNSCSDKNYEGNNDYERMISKIEKKFLSKVSTFTDNKDLIDLKGDDFHSSTVLISSVEKALSNFSRDEYFIIVPVSGHGSIREKTNQEDKTHKKTRYRKTALSYRKLADMFFGNEDNFKYYLDNIGTGLDYPKPVFKCSDAHSIEELNSNKYSWVKADLLNNNTTWIGLQQSIFMPKERVNVSDLNNIEVKDNCITSVNINVHDNRQSWFKHSNLDINKNLVSIIGCKGSGKSALAEIIAYSHNALDLKIEGANGKEHDNDNLFLIRSKDTLKNTSFKVNDNDIDIGKGAVLEKTYTYDAPVMHYSQKYVDDLCSQENQFYLEKEVKRVIFQNLKELSTDDIYSSDLDSYITEITKDISIKKDMYIKEIECICSKIVKNINNYKKLHTSIYPSIKRLKGEEKLKIQELEKIKKQITSKDLEDVNKQRGVIQSHKYTLKDSKNILLKIEELKAHIDSKNKEILNWNNFTENNIYNIMRNSIEKDELSNLLDSLDNFSFKQIIPNSNLEDLKNKLIERISGIENILFKLEPELEAKLKVLGVVAEKENNLNKRLQAITNELSSLEGDKNAFEENISDNEKLVTSYNDTSKLYLSQLDEMKLKVDEISSNITSSSQKFEIKTSIESPKAYINNMIRDNIINNKYLSDNEELSLELISNIISGNILNINKFVSILKNIDDINLLEDKFFKSGNDTESFMNFIMVTILEKLELKYNIYYENNPIKFLSSGKKGIALITLLLELDKDPRPLIIDQPEDNLDSKSVYEDLVSIFKNRKHDRQIILVTHNPNLVINTDSEQVIIADNKPKDQKQNISYRTGSIEGLKKDICEILEGGKEAFKQRESVYNISRS